MWNEVPSTTAPKPKPPSKQPCKHKWVFQTSDYKFTYNTYGNSEYERIDTYYCENCLEQKEIVAKYEYSRETPYWFKRG